MLILEQRDLLCGFRFGKSHVCIQHRFRDQHRQKVLPSEDDYFLELSPETDLSIDLCVTVKMSMVRGLCCGICRPPFGELFDALEIGG